MALPVWDVSVSFEGPVYLDSNVLVGFVVSNHSLAAPAGQIVGEILASRKGIVLSAGTPMRTIAEQLGHRNPALTARVYAHVVPEAQREAIRSIGRKSG